MEYGVCKDADILNFWNQHKVVWACDQSKFGMEDEWFHYPLDIEDWLEWVYEAIQQCPPYTPNSEIETGFDCDDFADFFPAWCKAKHKANAVWEVWGETPQGGHAWNAIMTGEGMYEIEPQNGECWPFGANSGYKVIIAK